MHAMAERLRPKRSTEKTSTVLQRRGTSGALSRNRTRTTRLHPGMDATAPLHLPGANRVAIAHPTLQSGDTCPECGEGRVYRQKEPATLVRIVGQAPLKTTVFEMERLRCNACGADLHGR